MAKKKYYTASGGQLNVFVGSDRLAIHQAHETEDPAEIEALDGYIGRGLQDTDPRVPRKKAPAKAPTEK